MRLIFGFILVIGITIAAATAWNVFFRPIPDPVAQMAVVDEEMSGIAGVVTESRERAQIIHERTHEIRFIPQEVRRNVAALDSDSVADGIMAELELFRRSAGSAGGVDNTSERVLFDGAGGTRRVVRAPISTRRE